MRRRSNAGREYQFLSIDALASERVHGRFVTLRFENGSGALSGHIPVILLVVRICTACSCNHQPCLLLPSQEVLRRSGTELERKHADRILPVSHQLACCTTALCRPLHLRSRC